MAITKRKLQKEVALYGTMVDLAEGKLAKPALAAWLQANAQTI